VPLLVDDDAMLVKNDRRQAMSRADLEKLLDKNVIEKL
jgi:hypothetical protein